MFKIGDKITLKPSVDYIEDNDTWTINGIVRNNEGEIVYNMTNQMGAGATGAWKGVDGAYRKVESSSQAKESSSQAKPKTKPKTSKRKGNSSNKGNSSRGSDNYPPSKRMRIGGKRRKTRRRNSRK
tara:strand:- start:1186 stop:1563 length:378 start_codon:yes stop_codon:yes gene_type:complete